MAMPVRATAPRSPAECPARRRSCAIHYNRFSWSITRRRYRLGSRHVYTENAEDEFPNVCRFVSAVFPSEDDDVITSPYNSVLSFLSFARMRIACCP